MASSKKGTPPVGEKDTLTHDHFEMNEKDELVIKLEEIVKIMKKKAYQSPTKLRNTCIGGGGATVR